MLTLLVIPGAVVYAGFFSIFGDIFSKMNTIERPVTSQNIALLAAVPASDMNPNENGDPNIVGGGALIPDAGPEGASADLSDQDVEHGQISIYVVRDGDSLASIGKMFNVSVNTILWANNMQKGAKLHVGDTLVILPVSGVELTVKKGDTVESLAKKYKGDPDEVRGYNGLADAEQPAIGSTIIIPDGEMPSAPAQRTKPATSKLHGAGGPDLAGYYRSPLSTYRKSQGLHGYNGVDLVEYIGAPVMAAAEGDVVVARQGGYNGGYGNYVVISHANGTQTLYGHLQSVAISPGQHVAQGQLIGYLGNTGRSTGPHLHFEVRGARNPF